MDDIKKEIAKTYDKQRMYRTYAAVVYHDGLVMYEKITRSKMLDKILEIYNSYNDVFIDFCLIREIDFLKRFNDYLKGKDDKLEKEVKEGKFIREINDLCNKMILAYKDKNFYYSISETTKLDIKKLMFFEETKKTILKKINNFDLKKKKQKEAYMAYVIGFMKTHIFVNQIEFIELVIKRLKNEFKISADEVEKVIYNPLFLYYISLNDFYNLEEDDDGFDFSEAMRLGFFVYSDKEYFVSEMLKAYKNLEYKFVTKTLKISEYQEIFYYDYLISNPKIREMAEIIKSNDIGELYLNDIIYEGLDLETVKKDIENPFLITKKEAKKILEAALECPAPIYRGSTYNEYIKALKLREKHAKKNITKQTRSAINELKAERFLDIYYQLLNYTNITVHKTLNRGDELIPVEQMDYEEEMEVAQLLWENFDDFFPNFLDFHIFSENTNKKDLQLIQSIGKHRYRMYWLWKVEDEYTVFYSNEEKKFYMAKSIMGNIGEMFSEENILTLCNIVLIPIDNEILLESYVGFSNTIPHEALIKEMEELYTEENKIYKF